MEALSNDEIINILINLISIAFLVATVFTALYTYFLLPLLLSSSPSVSFGPEEEQFDVNEQDIEKEVEEKPINIKRFLWRPRLKFWLKQLSVLVTGVISIVQYYLRYNTFKFMCVFERFCFESLIFLNI